MRVQIEIHVLHRKQGDGHVIALLHLFLEDQVIAQALYADEYLCGRLLINQEINCDILQTRDVPV